ncbi:MAG: hypothetical protein IPM36_21975 [Lewinellaceae bacterium]|nr:hypothetical protein [Lewinellaceae bacterium]
MVVSKIQTAIAAYKNWLQRERNHPFLYKWESVQVFQLNWNPDDTDPAAMFERSFQNSQTRRLWQTEHWYPMRMMTGFWRIEPGMVRAMFDDLFNESRDVEARIGRFLFGCDELLRDFKQLNPTSVENNHYHDDYRMIALYLAFRYPEQYAPYDFAVFQQTMQHVQARDIPQQNDIGRYFKVLRILMNFLEKDPGVQAAMQRHLGPAKYYQGKTLLLAEDFCQFIARQLTPEASV